MVITLAQLGELQVATAQPNQRDAERHAIRAQAARHRDRGVVEQVDEVGVSAEVAVEHERGGLHGLDRVVRRRGRYEQQVDVVPHRCDSLGQGAQLDLRIDEVSRAVAATGCEDAAHRLDYVDLVRIEEFAHRGIALGNQGAVIKQCSDGTERRVIDGELNAAHVLEAHDGVCEGGLRCVVAEEGQTRGHTESKTLRVRRVHQFERARVRVQCVKPLCCVQHLERHAHRASKDRNAVDTLRRRHHATRTDQPPRRFDPDDVVESRRHAARASGVGAEREVDLTGRDHIGRA